ncbi:uncharacterized protein B0H64DRAFT_446577 [Chaetomium fimeti]|uniref:BZIP domain-containing protein n=1 Tax=Chaetomium fimeti TaxID=1854472 RepID=A0AAE0LNP4_9PEZI|nr:hypothetical protein B0H64DRAFT_446577 [Chaetomium fimeti]
MRYPEGDLPILSAELYDDGPAFDSPRRLTATRKKQASSSSRGPEDGPRKRARAQVADASEHEDEGKRARGRPRLDTKDETAADRRRTQIRLAQRAYRNRKENAIQTLEKKVQGLKDTNEEMSNAFMQLHDFALGSGLLDQLPEFGRQLRETTERFLSLAREASDDVAKDGEPNGITSSPEGKKPSNGRASSDSPGQSNSATPTATTIPSELGLEETPETLRDGLMPSYEPTTQADFNPAITLAQQQQSLVSLPPQDKPGLPTFAYEVLTHPTLENASFPFQPNPSPSIFTGFPTPSLSQSPVPLDTYASFETTFGRRVHRYSLEQALILLTMPSPPQALIMRVFGFCLQLESPATIQRRLRRMLVRDTQQSLFNWQFPFFNLGGAGTHFDDPTTATSPQDQPQGQQPPRRPMGNQGTADVLKPGETAGFAAGPFSAEVNAVRDRDLRADMRMALPGFAGEYFDCDEAEMYLYQRGVVIPPGSDVVTVDVDVDQLHTYRESGWRAETVDLLGGSPESPGSSSLGSGVSALGESGVRDAGVGSSWRMGDGGAGMVDPALADVFSQGNNPFMPATTMAGSSMGAGDDMLPFGFMGSDVLGSAGYGIQDLNRRRVVLDVTRLVKELTSRGICLGRTPGFKQADIDDSFWESVKHGLGA